MSRPAGIRSYGSPFRRPNKKGPAGTKVGISEKVLEELPATFSNLEQEINLEREERIALRLQLKKAEAARKHSRIQKLRREINYSLEVTLYLEGLAWCSSCRCSSGNCHCDDPDYEAPVREEIIFPKQEVREVKVRVISSTGHEML